MRPVHHRLKMLDSSIVVLGSAAKSFAERVEAHHGRHADATIDLAPAGAPSLTYVALRLGVVRGYTTTLHFYAFDDDERLAPALERMLPHVTAILLAHEEDRLSFLVQVAARHQRARRSRPAAVVIAGIDVLRERWAIASEKNVEAPAIAIE